MKKISTSGAVAMLMAVVLAGCGRDSVKVYHVDTNETVTAPPAAMPTTMPAGMSGNIPVPDNSNLPKLKYVLPSGWKEKELTQLRVASFDVSENGKTADVSVIPLGGSSGGDTANVNRWRGQVGQPALEESELAKSAEAVEIAGQSGSLYDIAGTSPGSGDEQRILGAILHGDETVWYFKMMGDAALVEKQKANFIAFLKSADFGKLPAPSTMEMSKLPPSHPAIPGMNTPGQAATGDATAKPTWTVPAGWQEGELAQFLVARFVIQGGDNAVALVNVSKLDGDGGGLVPNVNRWRAQLGLPPASEEDIAKLPTIDASGAKAVVADYAGTDPKTQKSARLVGVVVPQNGQTWFYKLMGDVNLVGAQKDALIQFVQSAKYPAGQ
jgi:hypothetical protein